MTGSFVCVNTRFLPLLKSRLIGSYGLKWMDWMEENHPDKVEWMRFQHNYLTAARSLDKRAWEYRNRLDDAEPAITDECAHIRKELNAFSEEYGLGELNLRFMQGNQVGIYEKYADSPKRAKRF